MDGFNHKYLALALPLGVFFFLFSALAPWAQARDFNPATTWIGLIDIRDKNFIELGRQIEQTTGLKVEVDPLLREKPVSLTLERVTLSGVLDVAVPAMGATAVIRPDRSILISPLLSPWSGPETSNDAFVDEFPRQPYRFQKTSPVQFTHQLRALHQINTVLDYRVEIRPIVLEFRHATVREVLDAACAVNHWQWKAFQGVVVILPAGEEALFNFYSPKWSKWSFHHQSLARIGQQLSHDFGIPMRISSNAGAIRREGHFPGATFGEIIDLMSREWRMSYAAHNGVLNFFTYRDRIYLSDTASPPAIQLNLELIEVPRSVWENEALDRDILTSPGLSEENLERLRQGILEMPNVQSRLKKQLEMDHSKSLSTTEEVSFDTGAGSLGYHVVYRDLNEKFCRLRLRFEAVTVDGEKLFETKTFEEQVIQLGKPFLFDLTPVLPDKKDPTIKLVYLKANHILPDHGNRPIAVNLRTARGPTRRTDLHEKRYFRQFPPGQRLEFLPLFQPGKTQDNRTAASVEK